MLRGTPEEENLWSKILDDVQSRSANSMPQASILILGDNDSGKTTLVARLQRVDDPKKGTGLEYHYLEVNPDFREGLFAYQLGSALPDVVPGESARLGVWVLDGDPCYSSMIRFALNSENLDRTLVVICASMAEPGTLIDSLKRWAKILEQHFQSEYNAYDKNLIRDCRDRQIRFWQEYVEPLDSSSHSDMGAKVPSMETDHILLPLNGSTLTNNLGLPLVVVISKCDTMSVLEKEFDFKDEHFDFIQQYVRKFCLQYGAALVYTSAKDSRNIDVLYKYVLHRIYGFPFTQPASVVEKDAIFIPGGWDNEKKISILYENMVSMKPNDIYNDHIKKPTLNKPQQRDIEIQSENEQNFLARQLNIINTQTPPQAANPTIIHRPDLSASPSLQQRKNPSPMINVQNSLSSSNVKKPDGVRTTPGSAAGTTQEGVLAQFFNNLLNKKTTGTAVPTTTTAVPMHAAASVPGGTRPMDKMAFTNETAAAELNRMLGDQQRTKSSDDVPSIPLQNGQSSSSDETHQQQQQTPQNSEISQTAS